MGEGIMRGTTKAMGALEILEAGLLTTVQDAGRCGWLRYGVPPSGPLDAVAFQAANILVGNPPEAAGLEITWSGPTLRITRDALVAVCGADFELWAGRLPVPTWHSVALRAGQVLRFGARRSGARAYLAVDGGVALPPYLGSQATYLPGGFGGLEGRALRAGDRLPLSPGQRDPFAAAGKPWPASSRPPYSPHPTLRVILGPQAEAFTAEGLATFLNAAYTLTPASNRMGARLQGPAIAHAGAADIISDGVIAGCVQVPADGQPIILLADHQTTGGYPKIAAVLQADLPLVAQLLPGDQVRFQAVALPLSPRTC
ncbi:MAG TPA: biotin-dependent carboxyltransferase family protein [Anaerolineae bacterium]|nr:biotin-dependent carboxyltransferase family protein [Anaerolineae bacterium]